MAHVLIINAPIVAMQKSIHRTEMLGIEYLAAALRKDGHAVEVWDPTLGLGTLRSDGLFAFGPAAGEVERRIRASSPTVVAISCHYGFSAEDAYALARTAKMVDPAIVTVMGGLFVSINEGLVLKGCDAVDYAISGEAEESCCDLLRRLPLANPGLADVDGLIYRAEGVVKVNHKEHFIEDLDALPHPARDLVPVDAYMHGSTEYQLYGLGFRPALSLLTSRSCPMGCTYCNMKLVHGKNWRPRSVASCVDELEEMSNRWGARHVFIMDDYFNLKVDRAKGFCHEILRRGLKIRWNTPNGISVKNIDHELADLMRRAGCANVCVAIESGSEEVRRKLMNKPTSNVDIINAITQFSAVGVPVVGFVMLGMPGETAAQIQESVAFIRKLPLTSVVVSFVVPFRGTELYRSLERTNQVVCDGSVSIDDYKHPLYLPEGMSTGELEQVRNDLRAGFTSLGRLRQIEEERERQGVEALVSSPG